MAFDFNNYYKLEYIESSGTQYINTGITESNYIAVECKFYNPNPVNHYLFGAQQNSSYMMYNGLYGSGILEYNWSTLRYTASNMVELSQTLSGNTLTSAINDKTYTQSIGTSSNSTFYIFACNEGARLYTSTLRLYYFKIYNDAQSTLARNFTPAKRKSDNVIGLYDEVNEVFYTNAGSGSFTGGGV